MIKAHYENIPLEWDSATGRRIKTWIFDCRACKSQRYAHVFESGFVIETENADLPTRQNLEFDPSERRIRNLYLINGIEGLIESPIKLKETLGSAHVRSFHNTDLPPFVIKQV